MELFRLDGIYFQFMTTNYSLANLIKLIIIEIIF